MPDPHPPSRQLDELRENLSALPAAVRERDQQLKKLNDWSDRLLQDFKNILASNRWRLGCWLSLKRAGERSKEAKRLEGLIALRPPRVQGRPITASQVGLNAAPPIASPPPSPVAPGANPLVEVGQLISVIIVVNGGSDDLRRCLESVERNSQAHHLILAIDDASLDSGVWPLLRQWEAQRSNFRAFQNSSRLGYEATARLGGDLAGPGDIILLQSDAVVPPRWIKRVAARAYSRENVATVESKAAVNGNPVCLYLTAAARTALGEFSDGYLACTAAAGLINLVDDTIFRPAGTEPETAPSDRRPCLLYVLHDGTGGTRFTSQDLSDAMAESYRVLLLLTALDHWTLCEYREGKITPVRRYAFTRIWRVDQALLADRLSALREICTDYRVALAHVRHLLGSGPELLDALRELHIRIVFSFHDFYTICPTIQLLDETRTYCAGVCTAGPGDCPLPANWFRPPLPWLKHRYVHEHQDRMAAALEGCDAFVTTSESSRELLTDRFPGLAGPRFTVIEHGRDLRRLELAEAPVSGKPLRAIFFGALNPAKGVKLIVELLQENRQASSPLLELHVLGLKHLDFVAEEVGAIYHGPYRREELAEKVAAIGPAVSLIPSLWPETYCHVLTESWAMGLPVLASDIGTLRERVLRQGGGWLLPVGDSQTWFAKLRELASDRENYAAALQQIRGMEFPHIATMTRSYAAIYNRLLQPLAAE